MIHQSNYYQFFNILDFFPGVIIILHIHFSFAIRFYFISRQFDKMFL